MRPRRLCTTLLYGILILVACDAPATDEENPLEGLPEATLTETLRLGGADAPEAEAFDVPPSLAVDPEGRLYALHRGRAQVALFDPEGSFVHWVAGAGSGPGEFTIPVRLGLVGDTLWVGDGVSQRISRFGPDGAHLSTRTAPWDFGIPMGAPQSEGGYLEGGRVWAEPTARPLGIEGRIDLPVLVGPPGLATADTLFHVRVPRRNLQGLFWAAFEVPPYHAVAPDGSGILLAEWDPASPATVELRFFDPGGQVTREATLPVPVRPMTSERRNEAIEEGTAQIEALGERLRESGLAEAEIPQPDRSITEAQLYLPENVPPIRRVQVGLDGSWWLQLADDMEAGPWLALDPEGIPRFTLHLPDEATLGLARLDRVWGITTDDFDVPGVVRWELEVP